MMTRASFMRIYAPLGKFWAQPFQKERDIVTRGFQAHGVTSVVTLNTAGRVKIGHQLHRTIRRRMLIASKVEHIHYLWIKHAHNL